MKRALQDRFAFMNRNLRLLTVRQVLGMFCRRMVLSYASLYILAVGGDDAQIGLVSALQPLAGLLVFPVSGSLTDRSGRVRLIAAAGYLSAATLLLYVFAPSWEWIAVGALLQGFMVFQFPPLSAILADSMDPTTRGVGIATMNTLSNAVAMFSPYVAGLVLTLYGDNVGMRLLYALLAASLAVNATLVLRYLRETVVDAHRGFGTGVVALIREAYAGIPALVRSLPRSIKALAFVVGLAFIANGVTSPFWVVYVTEEIGLSSVEWGLILLAEAVFKTLLTIPCGVLADRYGRTRMLAVAVVLSLVSLPSLVLAQTFLHVLVIRLGVGLVGALFSPSSTALMADSIPRDTRGRVMAAIGRGTVMVGAAGGGTGGPGMGYLFTLPVMAASVSGGLLYTLNPAFPWLCVLGTTLAQLVCIVVFVRDPKHAER
jgi:MFS family permease